MTTAAEPYGCRWCGLPRPHGWQWIETARLHTWERPTDEQILARMRARRAERNTR